MSIKIVQKGHPALHRPADTVPIHEITSKKIQKVIADMKKALATQSDGVGLAAPQIGIPLRIFIVSGRIFDESFERGKGTSEAQQTPDLVFINPEITKLSKKAAWLSEGCLSVRPLYGEVKRSLNATVRAYDEHGVLFERGGGGLLAADAGRRRYPGAGVGRYCLRPESHGKRTWAGCHIVKSAHSQGG